jgi:K+-dependent Na+/Ca+ exchanger related-protein
MVIILFILGLLLVVKGGSWFVDAASWIAEATGIPKFIVGATIVSLATTAPEQMVSIIAVLGGSNGLGIGNAIGSVSCNLGLGLAFVVIFAPKVINVNKKDFSEKGILMFMGAVILWFLIRDTKLMPIESIILLGILIAFIAVNVKSIQLESKSAKKRVPIEKKSLTVNIIKFVLGAVCIVLGARLMVDSGTAIAKMLGVPESIIGLTLVAVGTSLPEIVTAITAVMKKESSMAVGNIIGANIIDLTMILSICSFLSGNGLTVDSSTIAVDIPVAIVLIVIMVFPTIMSGRFRKWQGVTAFGIYVGYVITLVM